MKYSFLMVLMFAISACHGPKEEQAVVGKGARIIVEFEIPKNFKRKQVYLESAPYAYVQLPSWSEEKPKVKDHLAKWVLFSDSPMVVNLYAILGPGNKLLLYEPGDSVHISLKEGKAIYSGRNADKFRMLDELKSKEALLPAPKDSGVTEVKSIGDYLKWSAYLDKKLELLETVYDSYKQQVTPLAFEYLKADRIAEIEHTRLMKFNKVLRRKTIDPAITTESLGAVFDTTACNKYVTWLQTYNGRTIRGYYFYDFVRRSVERQYNFDNAHDSLKDAKRKLIYAETAKSLYKDGVLHSCLSFLLTEQGLKEHTLMEDTPEIDTLLANFYALPGYPEYKLYVKQYEQKIRGWVAQINEKNKSGQ